MVSGSETNNNPYEEIARLIVSCVVDGDLVNETTPTSRSLAGPDNLHVWGPPLPPTFLQ
jgi:hypothetical protein